MPTITHAKTRHQITHGKIKHCKVWKCQAVSFSSMLFYFVKKSTYETFASFVFLSPKPTGFCLHTDRFSAAVKTHPRHKDHQQDIHCHPKITIAKHSNRKSARLFLTQGKKIFLLHLFSEMSESYCLKFSGSLFSDRWITDLADELNFLLEKRYSSVCTFWVFNLST